MERYHHSTCSRVHGMNIDGEVWDWFHVIDLCKVIHVKRGFGFPWFLLSGRDFFGVINIEAHATYTLSNDKRYIVLKWEANLERWVVLKASSSARAKYDIPMEHPVWTYAFVFCLPAFWGLEMGGNTDDKTWRIQRRSLRTWEVIKTMVGVRVIQWLQHDPTQTVKDGRAWIICGSSFVFNSRKAACYCPYPPARPPVEGATTRPGIPECVLLGLHAGRRRLIMLLLITISLFSSLSVIPRISLISLVSLKRDPKGVNSILL